jgi:hypothetical protein
MMYEAPVLIVVGSVAELTECEDYCSVTQPC